MTVYVDDARIPARVGSIRARWSHLLSDSTDPGELAVFARRLGLAPGWLQHPGTHGEHYDVTAGKRRAAIELGATPIAYPRGLAAVLATKKNPHDQHRGDDPATGPRPDTAAGPLGPHHPTNSHGTGEADGRT